MKSPASQTIFDYDPPSLKEEDFNVHLIKSLIPHYNGYHLSLNELVQEDNILSNGDRITGRASSSDFTLPELDNLIKSKTPEIPKLLEDLKAKLQSLKTELNPIIAKINKPSKTNYEQILLMLKTKNRLILGYLSYLSFYIFLKFNGQFTNRHPIVLRLLEFRNLIEKLKPIEKKLQYQANKLLEEKGDEDEIKPRPNHLVDPLSDQSKAAEVTSDNTVYTHSKLLPVSYTNNHLSLLEKAEQRLERLKKNVSRNELVKSFKSQLEGTPEELSAHSHNGLGKLYGESELIDFNPFTKTQNKKKSSSMGVNTLDELVDYAQHITEQTNSNKKHKNDYTSNLTNLKGSASKLSEILQKSNKIVQPKIFKRNPVTEPLLRDISPNDDNQATDEHTHSEDDIYKQFRLQRKEAKEAKSNQLIKRQTQHIPSIDEFFTPNKKRPTNAIIDDNKGLTRKRKKIEGNARVHYRHKHEKKMKKHKSTHTHMKEEGSKGYEGETSGLSTKLAKSVKFK